jgi:hypothetical protein
MGTVRPERSELRDVAKEGFAKYGIKACEKWIAVDKIRILANI